MYRLTIPLTQHTPMIHFQSDQEGHTLRASELKPKLDKFLCKLYGASIDKSFISKRGQFEARGGVYALDYKVSISALEADRNKELSAPTTISYLKRDGSLGEDKFPSFFGDLGEKDGHTKMMSFHNRLTVTFISRHAGLLDIIDQNVAKFFIQHNFGTRQTKGFGSFYPADTRKYSLPEDLLFFELDLNSAPVAKFNYQPKRSDAFLRMYRLFDIVRLFYSTLRSGLNVGFGPNQFYFKSIMFLYAKEKLGVSWEKKKIKKQFFDRELYDQQRKHGANSDILSDDTRESYLMRDLLGLSGLQQWYTYRKNQISIECLDSDISRHTSPLTFSPIRLDFNRYRIYMVINQEGVDNLLGKRFRIQEQSGKSFEMVTPPHGKFSLYDFLKFAFNVNVGKHIHVLRGNPPEIALLTNIYEQLKSKMK